MSQNPALDSGEYVEPGGVIKIGKLVGTILGSIWLTFIGGWISVMEAIARAHISVLNAIGSMFTGILTAFGQGGAETLRTSWGAAFRAAYEINPIIAPAILSVELIVVSALLLWASRRWS